MCGVLGGVQGRDAACAIPVCADQQRQEWHRSQCIWGKNYTGILYIFWQA